MEEKKSKENVNKKDFRKSKIAMIITIIAVAVLAIIAGVVVFYLASPEIKKIPTNLKVENVEGQYYLTADYQTEYDYLFVIEQKIEGEYLEIDVVESDKNTINLSENEKILLTSGNEFRFMVAYMGENKSTGSFSEFYFWTVTMPLDKPIVTFENNMLSWDKIINAESYTVKIIYPEPNSPIKDFTVQENYFDMSTYANGYYQAYVTANASENFYSATSNLISFQIV